MLRIIEVRAWLRLDLSAVSCGMCTVWVAFKLAGDTYWTCNLPLCA